MRNRSNKKPRDTGQPASNDVPMTDEQVVLPRVKNAAAVELGRLGGKKGGIARAKKLTKEQRSEIAKKAARARWNKGK